MALIPNQLTPPEISLGIDVTPIINTLNNLLIQGVMPFDPTHNYVIGSLLTSPSGNVVQMKTTYIAGDPIPDFSNPLVAINLSGYATRTQAGLIRLSTPTQVLAGLDASTAVTPLTLVAKLQSDTAKATTSTYGTVILARDSDMAGLTDTTRVITPSNLNALDATSALKGLTIYASNPEVRALTINNKSITPSGLNSLDANTTQKGLVIRATQADLDAGTDDTKYVTPYLLNYKFGASYATTTTPGFVMLATNADALALTNTTKVITPSNLGAMLSTTTQKGITAYATDAELLSLASTSKAVTPSNLNILIASSTQKGLVTLSTNTIAQALTDNNTVLTPYLLGNINSTTTQKGITTFATSAELISLQTQYKAIDPITLGTLTASNTQPGLITIATNSEMIIGTNNTKAISPLALQYNKPNGVAGLDANGKVPANLLNVVGGMNFKGYYNPVTNSPDILNTTPQVNDYYVVSQNGQHNFGQGMLTLTINDKLVWNGSFWDQWIGSLSNASTTQAGVVRLSTNVDALAMLDPGLAVTPANLSAIKASETQVGFTQYATAAETLQLASTTKVITPNALGLLNANNTQRGLSRFATVAELQSLTDNSIGVTPLALASLIATDTNLGLVRFATTQELQSLTSNTVAITPYGISNLTATTLTKGMTQLATDADTLGLTVNNKVVTPSNLGALNASETQIGLSRFSTAGELANLTQTATSINPATLGTLVATASQLGLVTLANSSQVMSFSGNTAITADNLGTASASVSDVSSKTLNKIVTPTAMRGYLDTIGIANTSNTIITIDTNLQLGALENGGSYYVLGLLMPKPTEAGYLQVIAGDENGTAAYLIVYSDGTSYTGVPNDLSVVKWYSAAAATANYAEMQANSNTLAVNVRQNNIQESQKQYPHWGAAQRKLITSSDNTLLNYTTSTTYTDVCWNNNFGIAVSVGTYNNTSKKNFCVIDPTNILSNDVFSEGLIASDDSNVIINTLTYTIAGTNPATGDDYPLDSTTIPSLTDATITSGQIVASADEATATTWNLALDNSKIITLKPKLNIMMTPLELVPAATLTSLKLKSSQSNLLTTGDKIIYGISDTNDYYQSDSLTISQMNTLDYGVSTSPTAITLPNGASKYITSFITNNVLCVATISASGVLYICVGEGSYNIEITCPDTFINASGVFNYNVGALVYIIVLNGENLVVYTYDNVANTLVLLQTINSSAVGVTFVNAQVQNNNLLLLDSTNTLNAYTFSTNYTLITGSTLTNINDFSISDTRLVIYYKNTSDYTLSVYHYDLVNTTNISQVYTTTITATLINDIWTGLVNSANAIIILADSKLYNYSWTNSAIVLSSTTDLLPNLNYDSFIIYDVAGSQYCSIACIDSSKSILSLQYFSDTYIIIDQVIDAGNGVYQLSFITTATNNILMSTSFNYSNNISVRNLQPAFLYSTTGTTFKVLPDNVVKAGQNLQYSTADTTPVYTLCEISDIINTAVNTFDISYKNIQQITGNTLQFYITSINNNDIISSISADITNSNEFVANNNFNGIIFSKYFNKFITVGDNGLIAFSEDTNNWTIVSTTTTNNFYSIVECLGDNIILAISAGLIYKSSDLINWVAIDVSSKMPINSSSLLIDSTYSLKDNTVIITFGSGIIYSSNLTDWTLFTDFPATLGSVSCNCITWNNIDNIYTIGNPFGYYISSDLITWVEKSTSVFPVTYCSFISSLNVTYCGSTTQSFFISNITGTAPQYTTNALPSMSTTFMECYGKLLYLTNTNEFNTSTNSALSVPTF